MHFVNRNILPLILIAYVGIVLILIYVGHVNEKAFSEMTAASDESRQIKEQSESILRYALSDVDKHVRAIVISKSSIFQENFMTAKITGMAQVDSLERRIRIQRERKPDFSAAHDSILVLLGQTRSSIKDYLSFCDSIVSAANRDSVAVAGQMIERDMGMFPFLAWRKMNDAVVKTESRLARQATGVSEGTVLLTRWFGYLSALFLIVS